LPPLTRNRRHVIIAASSNLNKFFFLDCEDGNVYVGTRNLLVDGEMMVCVPEQASGSEEEAQDGMLRWLEHYAHCLQSGMFHVRTEEGSRSISLYPETEPYCTTAVTRGVQVWLDSIHPNFNCQLQRSCRQCMLLHEAFCTL
jgi:F-box protein 3